MLIDEDARRLQARDVHVDLAVVGASADPALVYTSLAAASLCVKFCEIRAAHALGVQHAAIAVAHAAAIHQPRGAAGAVEIER